MDKMKQNTPDVLALFINPALIGISSGIMLKSVRFNHSSNIDSDKITIISNP